MRALAGPAMLAVIVGGFALHRALSAPDAPSRSFLDREVAAPPNADPDEDAGTCYALSTVIIANTMFSSATLDWKPAHENAWTLSIEEVVQDGRGPRREFQRLTFEAHGDLVRLVDVEASEGRESDLTTTLDALLAPANERSTPVDRCLEPGAVGYRFRPRR
jgi:hypothetical protein